MSRGLLVAADVGNSHAVVGVFRGEELVADYRLSTDPERTADEYAALLLPLLRRSEISPGEVEAVVISSVVPTLNPVLESTSRDLFGCEPLFVQPGIKTGMPIAADDPAEVGADRIVNAVAALDRYGAPVVVVDFGTATTFDVVTSRGEYAGGIIAPGIGISAEALFSRAARLYRVDLEPPPGIVGRNTVAAMQSGIYYGYLGLVDGILERLRSELPDLETVVATGGYARMIAPGSRFVTEVDDELTLVGLRLLHERNR